MPSPWVEFFEADGIWPHSQIIQNPLFPEVWLEHWQVCPVDEDTDAKIMVYGQFYPKKMKKKPRKCNIM